MFNAIRCWVKHCYSALTTTLARETFGVNMLISTEVMVCVHCASHFSALLLNIMIEE